MSIAQNKTLYRRFIQEVFNQGRLDVVDEILAPYYVGPRHLAFRAVPKASNMTSAADA